MAQVAPTQRLTIASSRQAFQLAYRTKEIKPCNRGGACIFDPSMKNLLLIKSTVSGKWGLPKGIRDRHKDKTDLMTCIRETREEIGYDIELATPLLPSIIVEDAKIYGLVVSMDTPFKKQTKEIADIRWISIEALQNEIKNNAEIFTRMLKLFVQKRRMTTLYNKIMVYKENYEVIKGQMNIYLHRILKSFNIIYKKSYDKYYEIYMRINRLYPGVFTEGDLIEYISHMKF